VVLAGSKNPIPSRTRPLISPAPMVLSLKTWKSRSLPGLPKTDIPLQRCSSSRSTMFNHEPAPSRAAVLSVVERTRRQATVRSRLFTENESDQAGIMFRSLAIGLTSPASLQSARSAASLAGAFGASAGVGFFKIDKMAPAGIAEWVGASRGGTTALHHKRLGRNMRKLTLRRTN
jgi:hypothetical protein